MALPFARLGGAALALAVVASAGSAAAKNEPAKGPAAHLRLAHSYAEAMAEAKDRGCVVFATFHEDG